MVKLSLRVVAAALVIGTFWTVGARAEFPDRPVHIIVPSPAGGATDILARILGQKLSQLWGQSVVVENRPGGLGVIGTDAVAKAAPDGYTIGLLASNHAINPLVVHDLPYDTFKSFAPVATVAVVPGVLVVNQSVLDVKDLKSAIDAARNNPGKYNYASPLALTAGQRSMELLKHDAKVDIQMIPYNGGPPAVNDLLAGNVQFLVIAIPTVSPYIAAGRLRALAVTSPQRFEGLPDVPTIAESGYPGFDSVEWYAMFTRSGVPPAVVQKLSTDIDAILARPEIHAQFLKLGAYPGQGGAAELATRLQGEYERWRVLTKDINLQAN